jgi:hypothetical protein
LSASTAIFRPEEEAFVRGIFTTFVEPAPAAEQHGMKKVRTARRWVGVRPARTSRFGTLSDSSYS